MNFIKGLFKRKLFLIGLGIVLVGGGYYGYKAIFVKAAPTRYNTAQVTKGTITSSVSGTGQVAATNQVDIKPSASGQITSVSVKQGDQVKNGQTLATIDSRTASAQLAQAQASLAQAEANYQKVIAGATGSDLTTTQNVVTNAKQDLDDAQTNLPTVTTQQARAVSTALSNMYNAGLSALPNNTSTTATLTLSGSYNGTTEGQYNISLMQYPDGFYYIVSGLGTQNNKLQRGIAQPLGDGLYFTVSTNGVLDVSTSWIISVPNRASSSYLPAYNAYQTALENQTQNVKQAQDVITKAQTALDQAQQALADKVAPADNATVLSAQASVKQAQASLISAQTNYSNTRITAPFDGVVAALSMSRGDQASSGTTVATLTTTQKVAEISLNEVDAAKVKVGQKVTLTFSAIDGLTVTGSVGEADLIGTVTQNVVSFKVKILFDTQDDRVKPGMSASASIITDVKQDVLMAPSAAVKTNGGQSYVQALVNGSPVQHNVTVGISNDTDTEISGDIKEGDEVVTQTITATAAKTSTTQQSSILQGLGGGGAAGRATGGGTGFGGGAGRGGN